MKEEEEFITRDGQKLHSLSDLFFWVLTCNEEDFMYHASNNDFYIWLKEVLKEEEVAEDIKNVRDREEFVGILKKYLFGRGEIEKVDKAKAFLIFSSLLE